MKLLATIPHSGEKIPAQCDWLLKLPEPILFADADRYVDQLYQTALEQLKISVIKTDWHRYVVDLNRLPTDIDESSVIGCSTPAGTHPRGYHWVYTTKKETIMAQPMTAELHQQLTQLVYDEFHSKVAASAAEIRRIQKEVFHLDLHSMPSMGTSEHRDPGEARADIVVSDSLGKSAKKEFVDLVLTSFTRAGFKVGYNWPYMGGRITERYGSPSVGHHCVQVELNRKLYMNEVTKKPVSELWPALQKKLHLALTHVQEGLPRI